MFLGVKPGHQLSGYAIQRNGTQRDCWFVVKAEGGFHLKPQVVCPSPQASQAWPLPSGQGGPGLLGLWSGEAFQPKRE